MDLIAPNKKNTHHHKTDERKLRRYKRRWKVERLLAWIKRWRRIHTRWEHKAENLLPAQTAIAVLRGALI